MTPKEKAKELVDWFLEEGLYSFGRYQYSDVEDREGSKFCATKLVDTNTSKKVTIFIISVLTNYLYQNFYRGDILAKNHDIFARVNLNQLQIVRVNRKF